MYYESIINILLKLKEILSSIKEVKEVCTKLKATANEYVFPRIDILPERQVIEEGPICSNTRHLIFTIRIVPALKAYTSDVGTDELLKITGQIYDLVYANRPQFLHELCDDIRVDNIENFYFTGDNYVLYVASIICVCELFI